MELTPTGAGWLERWQSRLRVRTRVRRWRRRRDPGRTGLPRVLVNGFPKAGTHLLKRTVSLLPGMVHENLWVPPDRVLRQMTPEMGGEVAARVPLPPELGKIERLLSSLEPGEYLMGHVHCTPGFVRLLERQNFRSVLILRDPRDVAVSLAFHIVKHPEHRLHGYFTGKLQTEEERLLVCIAGVKAPGDLTLPSIGKRLGHFLLWLRVPLNYTTRFERLVGAQGGGSAEAQRAEVENIARHLGFTLSSEQIQAIAARVFWQESFTFRRGEVGSWKNYFKDEHKNAFKQVAGKLLIELGYERNLDW